MQIVWQDMRSALILALALLAAACESSPKTTPLPTAPSEEAPAGDGGGGPSAPFVVGNWNLEWFGSTTEGPTDEALQQKNVTTVMRAIDAQLWSVQEISSEAQLRAVATDLGNFEVVLGDGGSQKLAALVRRDRFDVLGSRVVLKDKEADFNFRPPLELDLALRPGGRPLTFIVVHLAAGTDVASYEKRKLEAQLLKGHLDAKPAGTRVLVAGDFNDGLEQSSYQRSETPFSILLSDPAYAFTTKGLKSPRYPRVIDHQLVTDDLLAGYVEGSAKVVDGDTIIASGYTTTTSDHDATRAEYMLP